MRENLIDSNGLPAILLLHYKSAQTWYDSRIYIFILNCIPLFVLMCVSAHLLLNNC
jgi:hypothetical protein